MSVPEVVPDESGFYEVWFDGVCCGYGLLAGQAYAIANAAIVWQDKGWGILPEPPDAPTTRPGTGGPRT